MAKFFCKSDELRKLIIYRAKFYGIPLAHLFSGTYQGFVKFTENYLNAKDLNECNTDYDDQVLLIAERLGIKPRVVLVVDSTDYDGVKMKEELENEFKEKRASSKA